MVLLTPDLLKNRREAGFSFLAFTLPFQGSGYCVTVSFQPVFYPCRGTKRGSAEERPSDERNELVP